jgi:hypothetical protein
LELSRFGCGLNTYLQWHICHLVASPFCRYFDLSNERDSKRFRKNGGDENGNGSNARKNY